MVHRRRRRALRYAPTATPVLAVAAGLLIVGAVSPPRESAVPARPAAAGPNWHARRAARATQQLSLGTPHWFVADGSITGLRQTGSVTWHGDIATLRNDGCTAPGRYLVRARGSNLHLRATSDRCPQRRALLIGTWRLDP